jgi:anti-sigma factor RsiW
MRHPSDEQLAAYVDGSLAPDEHASTEKHLAACSRCRADVHLAAETRRALAGLSEPAVPPRIGRGVVHQLDRLVAMDELPRDEDPSQEEAEDLPSGDAWVVGQRSRRPPRRGARWPLVVGVAAAAALVALGAFVISRDVFESTPSTANASRAAAPAEAGGGAGASQLPDAAAGPSFERQQTDYDSEAIAALAAATASNPLPGGAEAGAVTAPQGTAPQGFEDALRCASHWSQDAKGLVPLRIIVARYQHTPAVIAVYRQDDPDGAKVLVWVLSESDCNLLTFSQHAV